MSAIRAGRHCQPCRPGAAVGSAARPEARVRFGSPMNGPPNVSRPRRTPRPPRTHSSPSVVSSPDHSLSVAGLGHPMAARLCVSLPLCERRPSGRALCGHRRRRQTPRAVKRCGPTTTAAPMSIGPIANDAGAMESRPRFSKLLSVYRKGCATCLHALKVNTGSMTTCTPKSTADRPGGSVVHGRGPRYLPTATRPLRVPSRLDDPAQPLQGAGALGASAMTCADQRAG